METKENFKFHAPIQRGKKGLWCQRLSYKDANGQWKQTSRSGFLKKRDITIEVKNEMLKEVSMMMAINTETKDVTLSEFLGIYLSDKSHELTYNTKVTYKYTIHRLSNLPKKPINKITFSDCIKEISALSSHYSDNTIKSTVIILKTLFKQAIRYKIISVSPLNEYTYKPKSKEKKRIRIFTEKEADNLLEIYRNEDKQVWIILSLMRYCGLRVSEALGVCWSDITPDGLSVSKQFTHTEKGKAFTSTKTKNSNRVVPIPYKLKKILDEYRNIYPPFNETSRLTSIKYNVLYSIKRIYPNHSPHDFRHTYATKLLADGVDIRTVASLLGDIVATVEKIYIHYSDEMRKNAEKKLNEIFG